MTCKINADTSDGLKIVSDTSGEIEIQDNGATRLTVGDTSTFATDVTVTTAGSGVTDALKLKTTATNTVPAILFSGDFSDSQVDLSRIRCQQDSSTVSGLIFETKDSGTIAEKMRLTGGSGLLVGTTGTVSSTGSWTGSGDVKFHTTSPSLNLGAFGTVVSHTYRGVFFTNSLWNVYDESNVGVHLVGGNTSWTANSDERIKENIAELNGSDAYNHVKAARAVTFNWKQEAHNAKAGKKIGFIAQDWETNYPELVEETLASPQIVEEIDGIEDDTKIKGIQYTETVPVLMAALKEAIAKIEVLETKVAALESE